MSGTSLDGLDIASCEFTFETDWKFKILYSETIEYSEIWKSKLSNAFFLDNTGIESLDNEYGAYIAEVVMKFIQKYNLQIDLISSHGHTIFHKPKEKISLQIGSGRIIAQKLGIITISNFRQQDVMLGGQGAPLVPIGDHLLFSEYDLLLNLGGFANISWRNEKGIREACDIGPCNILFNAICNKINLNWFLRGHKKAGHRFQCPAPVGFSSQNFADLVYRFLSGGKLPLPNIPLPLKSGFEIRLIVPLRQLDAQRSSVLVSTPAKVLCDASINLSLIVFANVHILFSAGGLVWFDFLLPDFSLPH